MIYDSTTLGYDYTHIRTPQFPEVYITKNKNRLKQNGTSVYLNDKDEFELEIFNPSRTTVLAKIKINGNYISTSGLVVKPGRRIFLDRYLDTNNKFLFSTYTVEANNKEVQKAIEANGFIEVDFYNEKPQINVTTYSSSWIQPISSLRSLNEYFNGSVNYTNNTTTVNTPQANIGTSTNLRRFKSVSLSNASENFLNNASLDFMDQDLERSVDQSKGIETGRVELGEKSNTSFVKVQMEFSTQLNNKVTWKILPLSQKPIEASELKVFCGSCGSKRKKDSHKFCPNCGEKY
jgi:Zn finger protein HypA/HybF involved in hydrogenase expression